jgi:electron transport complex protein RnfG
MSAPRADKKISSVPRAGGDQSGSLRLVTTMAGIGLVCGVLIVLTFQLTFPVIEKNKTAALERAVFDVVPGAERKVTFRLVGATLERVESRELGGRVYHACYDGEDHLVGVAVEASGQGFQETIRLLYGYSPYQGAIVGMKILESKETPGLGDKIGKDAEFLSNFDSLVVRLDAAGAPAAQPIPLVKPGQKTAPWQIEAITGATISSRAVAAILESSVAGAAPVIAKNMPVLEGGAKP